MITQMDVVANKAYWLEVKMAKWSLARRFRIGVSGAKLRRLAMHKEERFYKNSRTSIYNNKIHKQIKMK
jgi:hypothetical protein